MRFLLQQHEPLDQFIARGFVFIPIDRNAIKVYSLEHGAFRRPEQAPHDTNALSYAAPTFTLCLQTLSLDLRPHDDRETYSRKIRC